MFIWTSYVSSVEIPLFGYKISGEALLCTGAAVAAISLYAVKKLCSFAPLPQKIFSEEELFWQTVEAIAVIRLPSLSPVFIKGMEMYPSLESAKLEMALEHNQRSYLLFKHLFPQCSPGRMLDLGCGTGENSIPFWEKGWTVFAIDKEPKAIELYLSTCRKIGKESLPKTLAESMENVSYPKNLDAVVALDVLPYVHPTRLRSTLQKIHAALRSEGVFIGSFFLTPKKPKDISKEKWEAIEGGVALAKALGAWFLPSDRSLQRLLHFAGFLPLWVQKWPKQGDLSTRLEFYAQKIN